jgi:hypothetical protein
MSNTAHNQKQAQGYKQSSSRQYFSSLSQNQAEAIPIPDHQAQHNQFAINLVDLQPKQYLSSTTKNQNGFLLNQPPNVISNT